MYEQTPFQCYPHSQVKETVRLAENFINANHYQQYGIFHIPPAVSRVTSTHYPVCYLAHTVTLVTFSSGIHF